ncbi:acyltransferase family protein [Lysobacter korlensis]|uniref:Acyltransferase family protein n=1 Tax=Lysobacter korlensis TaxID=553636 RepID=A0ABV6S0H5_9GAMM
MDVVLRDRRLDVLRGGLILSVVFGHLLETHGGWGWADPPQRALLTVLYAFHMPAFVFLTGIHAKADQVPLRIARLVSVLVVFQVLFLAFGWLIGHPIANWYSPYWVLWYVMAMIWWQALMPLIARFPRAALLTSVVVAVAVGIVDVHGNWFAFSRAAVFLPFFIAGYIWGKRAMIALPTAPAGAKAAVGGAFLVGVAVIFAANGDPHWLFGNWGYQQLGVAVVPGAIGRIGVMAVAATGVVALLMLAPARMPVLERPGRHSLAVFLFHVFAVELYAVALGAWGGEAPAAVAVTVAFLTAVVLTALFSARVFERGCRIVFRLPELRPRRIPVPRA